MLNRFMPRLSRRLRSTFRQPAAAQDYPTRPVIVIVPQPPGGGTDIITRIIADPLIQAARPELRRRKQNRRRHGGRHRRRRAGRARWLHAGHRSQRQHGGERQPVLQTRLRSDPRFHAGRHDGRISLRARRQQRLSGEVGQGPDRHGEGQAGQKSTSPRRATAAGSICRWSCSS